jgi:D-threo-aldose 1-dehydrogenase
MALLEAAFDAGIRHFDVARIYGTGDAEAVLGRFASRHRDEITVTTKFGIEPPAQSTSVTAAKALLRPLTRHSARLHRVALRGAHHSVKRGRFSPSDARNSLSRSLERLGTPFVDVFLLHDCTAADWCGETRETLEQLVTEGEIGCYGTATGFAETQTLLKSDSVKPAVAQFDSDAISSNVERLDGLLHGSTPITFSCLSHALTTLHRRLTADHDLAQEWSRALDLDLRSVDSLVSLLLCHAVNANRSGVTLFFSGEPERIRRNVLSVSEGRLEEGQLLEFARRARALASEPRA